MIKVLIVDDDNSLLEILRMRFESCGFAPCAADSFDSAMAMIREDIYDAAVFDMRLDGRTGLELMGEIKKYDSGLPVIFLTAYGTIDNAVEAMQEGAYSYLTKPFDYKELIAKVEEAVHENSFSREVLRSKQTETDSLIAGTIIGKSGKIQELRRNVTAAAGSDANVFIFGESGTGKELVARMLHALSTRNKENFVAVNSSAIPETLMESELFGHEKGAFTGADRKKQGLFEQAQKGSIFLDEISEMPVAMQTKLLRVLENREVTPLGGGKTIPLDIRLITASNKDLMEMIEQGDFRHDLFYRIHVIQIDIPALKERKEDLTMLCDHFIRKYTDRYKLEMKSISRDALDKIMEYDWPGNVRELENTLECAIVLNKSGQISADSIKFFKNTDNQITVYREAKLEFEFKFLKELMERTRGNISKAARMSDIYRSDLYELLKKHDIDPKEYR